MTFSVSAYNWLIPYQLAAIWVLDAVVTAVAVEGQSLQATANRWQCSLAWMRATVRSWIAVSAEFRTLVAQWSQALGWPELVNPTWRPPAAVRSGDWAWLCVAWAALAFQLLSGDQAGSMSGWVLWRTIAPEVMPAEPIPAVTHLGRRLRQRRSPPELEGVQAGPHPLSSE